MSHGCLGHGQYQINYLETGNSIGNKSGFWLKPPFLLGQINKTFHIIQKNGAGGKTMRMRTHISEEQDKCAIAPSSYHNTTYAVQMIPEEIHQQTQHINREPLISDIKNLLPFISLILVNNTTHEPLWDYLVSNYHYLGYRKLLGHSLKYLAFVNNRPVAALSWSAPAL